MKVIVQNTLTNRQWLGFEGPSGFTIGRDPACEIKLDSRFVSAQHARIERTDAGDTVGWELEVLPGANAVELDGKEVRAGAKTPLKGKSVLRLMEFVLTLEDVQREAAKAPGDEALTDLINVLHANVLRRLDLRAGAGSISWGRDFAGEGGSGRADQLNRIVDEVLLNDFKQQVFESDLTGLIVKRALRSRVSDWIFRKHAAQVGQSVSSSDWNQLGANKDLENYVAEAVHKVIQRCNFQENKPVPVNAEDVVDAQFDIHTDAVLPGMLENARAYLAISFIKKTLYDMIFGLGPLEDLLRSPAITEIMVVSPRQIYIERVGRLVKIPQTFPSEESCISIIERIVAPLGRRIDRSQPLVDARLRDGSRVNAIIEPLAIKGPCITIRKFPVFRVTSDDMIRWKSLTPSAIALLRACILWKASILISGGTGSGKTTLLNVLSGMIPNVERLVTIEDSAELRLQQEHVVSLETKPPNAEGKGQYTIRDLVKNSLRMRPDRIIVGECRGDEAVDMLQAMNTGHRGSMTTLHSNNTQDAIARLETMVLMGSDIPLPAVRRNIASALNVVVHVDRLSTGHRLVSQISEIIGIHPVSGEVETRDIMKAIDYNGVLTLRPTGYMPSFLGEMVEKGYLPLANWFEQVKT
jgi:pilus assembly protein CpaF